MRCVKHRRPLHRPVATVVAAAAFACFASAASAKPLYVGTWSASPDLCPAPNTDAHFIIKANSYHFFEENCAFRSVVRTAGAWNVVARCSGDGTRTTNRFTLWATKKVLTLRYAGEAGIANYVRCK